MIKIRFADNSDREKIIKYLAEKWNSNSPLVKSSNLFDYQYGRGGTCQFVIAIDEETGIIHGLKGYFYLNSESQPDVAAALAMVDQGIRPMLGMEIQRFLESQTNARWVCATGLNPNTSARVYKLFHRQYTVDRLNHYYRLNSSVKTKIAVIEDAEVLEVYQTNYDLKLLQTPEELIESYDLEKYKTSIPYKDISYIKYRYFNHPVYKYFLYGITAPNKKTAEAVFIAREVSYEGSKALRIVDYLGDHKCFGFVGVSINKLMQAFNYEYIDFYCFGIEDEIMSSAGFCKRDDSDPNIIPNYFEPYVQKNVDIWFFYTGKNPSLICKADGDQDRPNFEF